MIYETFWVTSNILPKINMSFSITHDIDPSKINSFEVVSGIDTSVNIKKFDIIGSIEQVLPSIQIQRVRN